MLSDRKIGRDRVPISALIAAARCTITWSRTHERTRIGIIVETGEAREVHHHCLLVGYGADAINPYLAFEALWQARARRRAAMRRTCRATTTSSTRTARPSPRAC